jgi:hypothetical protein
VVKKTTLYIPGLLAVFNCTEGLPTKEELPSNTPFEELLDCIDPSAEEVITLVILDPLACEECKTFSPTNTTVLVINVAKAAAFCTQELPTNDTVFCIKPVPDILV